MASSRHNRKKNASGPSAAASSVGADQDQPGEFLTTAQGLRLPDTDHSLKAGERGPTLLEDFHPREKITHFDHERVPERVVHARGAAAHGSPGSSRNNRRRRRVVTGDTAVKSFTDQLTAAVGLHRAWDRAPDVMASAIPPVLTS